LTGAEQTFRLLIVRSVDDDLTARARIRDAAITVVGTTGHARATVRQIAGAAGTSAALVLHHFGSKDGLLAACDDHVLTRFRDLSRRKTEHLRSPGLLAAMAGEPENAVLLPYLVRGVLEFGDFGREVFDLCVAETVRFQQQAVAGGLVLPSRDETGRAVVLTVLGLGTQVLAPYLAPTAGQDDLAQRVGLPVLELLTDGFFTDTEFLDRYREQVVGAPPPADPAGT
jgi:AcrR family transcriptional regulator